VRQLQHLGTMDISKDLNCLVCFNKCSLICSNSTKPPVIPGFVIFIIKVKNTTPLSIRIFSLRIT